MKILKVKEEIKTDDGDISVAYLVSKNNKFRFRQKWDGCCDIEIHYNNSTVDEPTYHFGKPEWSSVHICELKEYINMLNEVYQYAIDNGFEVD